NGATPQDPVSANTVFKMGSTDVTVAFEEKLKADAEVTEALPETYDTSIRVKKLKFESSKLTLKKSDKATKNTATPVAEGTAPEVVYVTENRDIVAVDKSGNFYPMGAGEATVTAYCGNKTAKCKVTVVSYTTDVAVRDTTDAVVNDTTIEMKGGEQAFLRVSFEPYDSTDSRNIKWKSDNKKVTVKNGIITAKEVKEAVTAEITASVKATGAEGGEITKKVKVHVTPVEMPAASGGDKTHTLSVKKSVKMVTAEGSNKTELAINIKAKKGADINAVKLISVKSTNPDVVSANIAEQIAADGNKGNAKAVISASKAGTAYIIVTTSADDGKSVNVKRCKVTVSSPATDIRVESGSLTVKDNKISMRKGSNGTVEVMLDPEFSTDLGKVKLSGSKGIKVKNGIIYASRVSGENKPAKLTVRCGKLKKVIEVNVTGK
nr:hypothetical protein [Lachnospiraceae bacterium]